MKHLATHSRGRAPASCQGSPRSAGTGDVTVPGPGRCYSLTWMVVAMFLPSRSS